MSQSFPKRSLITTAIVLSGWLLPLSFASHPHADLPQVIPGSRMMDSALSENEVYIIQNRLNGGVINAKLQLADLNGSNTQLWTIETRINGRSILRSLANGQAVRSGNHRWELHSKRNGYFRIRHSETSQDLTLDGGRLTWREYVGETSQHWKVYTARTTTTEKPDFNLTGWARTGRGTTGGEGGEVVTASSAEALIHYIDQPEPLIIRVEGTIDLGKTFEGYKSNGRYYVKSDKTIFGVGDDAAILHGELRLAGVSNVIIRNLTFSHAPDTAIAITHGTTHVWIDHNAFTQAGDGLLDITRASDFITISWNRFFNHDKVTLVGASDGESTDRGHLRVTYHHNWFQNTVQRHPRVRFGQVHLFNNYFDVTASAIGIGIEAQIVSEENFIRSAGAAYHTYDSPDQPGRFTDSGSLILRLTGNTSPRRNDGSGWIPGDHYPYSLNHALNVPSLVTRWAGTGIVAPPEPPRDRGDRRRPIDSRPGPARRH